MKRNFGMLLFFGVKNLVFKETLVLQQWGSGTLLKFCIDLVDKANCHHKETQRLMFWGLAFFYQSESDESGGLD